MRRFNQGYALVFVFIILVAILAIRWNHQRIEGRYQAEINEIASYTLDDWLEVLKLEELLGDPPVTPLPADQLPIRLTPAVPAEAGGQ